MVPDIHYEAEFLRTALLLGAIRPADVRAWADAHLSIDAEPVALLADVALAPAELTAVREALRPFVGPVPGASIGGTILTFLATDPRISTLGTADRVRILGQLRREIALEPGIAEAIKTFEDRWMLSSAGVGADPAIASDFDRWLERARASGFYLFTCGNADEQAALLGALSRKVVRDRRATVPRRDACCAWVVASGVGGRSSLVVNEALWRLALAEFSPLPIGSRIPYVSLPAEATLVMDESTTGAMGADEAAERLAAV